MIDTNYPKDKTIVDLFEEQVKLNPENTAIKFKNRELTYRELNEQSNQLAHYLIQNYNIQPDELVGIELERSEWMVIGILAIIKSGGAYVPIDPEYPEQRKSFIKEDANLKVIINEQELEKFRAVNNNNKKYPSTSPNIKLSPSSLMYVIYTSGTTGNPKGVLIEHKNVVRLLLNDAFQFDFVSADVWTMFHNYNFDFSVWEMYGALLYGGKLIIVSSEVAKDTHSFAALLIAEDVTVLNQTPSAFYNLSEVLRTNQSENHHHLRYVIFGGEALQPSKLEWWHQFYPTTNLVNMYGITETTVHVTYQEIGSKEITQGVSIIGKPIPTLSCYILDEQKQLSAIGQEGELYVGGLGVARGYLNRPELTKEKFITNPYNPSERLYRTGDLGRWREDGNLEYLGRMDDQVKIRGYRVELGEIEQAISSHPKSGQAVVIAMAINSTSDKELIAYTTGEATAEELKTYLKERLPSYMVPNYYVKLESIPLTSNGKVDRKTLPDPEGTGLQQGVYVAPITEIEKQLVSIWSTVLGVEESTLSIKADFFDLGGHSIKAIRLLGQVHKQLGVKIALKELFTHPTIEQISKLIKASSAQEDYASIPKTEEQEDYAVSSAQRRLWVLSKFDGANEAYNIPQVVRLEGSINESDFSSAYNNLLQRHEILRTVFSEDEHGNPRQRFLPITHQHFTIQQVDYSHQTKEEREASIKQYVSEEVSRGFSLEEGPLIRCSLLKETESSYVWVLVMHHIVSDGWSMGLLHREWSELYNAELEERPSNLPELSIQYKDYAAWHNGQLQSEDITAHKNYWLEQFKGELPVLELPSDKSRPKVMTYNGGSVYRELDKQTTDSLKAFSQHQGGTMFMTLQTALNILLHKYTGQEDIVIGSPIACREHPDLEGQIGFYLGVLPIRTTFSKEDTITTLYQKIKQNTLGAYSHQVYPYNELVDSLNLTRDTSRNPLFDAWLDYHNFDGYNINLENVSSKLLIDKRLDSSKFDLTVVVQDQQGGGLGVYWEYNRDIYSSLQMEQMERDFSEVLGSLATQQTSILIDYTILSTKDRERQLAHNPSPSPFDRRTVLERFEAVVKNSPKTRAIVLGSKELSYQELDEQSNRLANYLQTEHGINKGDRVGIKLERSIAQVVSVLGVLKTGAEYVPIDTDYPKERIAFMEQDSESKVIIDDEEWDQFNLQRTLYSSQAPDVELTPEDAMYVIYTSGSTGTPKGCILNYEGVSNYLEWTKEYSRGITYSEVDFFSSLSFDFTVTSLFGALTEGKTLRIYDSKEDLSGQLKQIVLNPESGWIKLTPAHIHLIEEETLRSARKKVFVLGGEALTEEQIKHLRKNQGCRIYNEYGPTEATVGCIVNEIGEDNEPYIGVPIPNSAVYLTDSTHNLVPYGSIGEICIGGVGLARGYLNRPDLTKEKFITNPYNPTERLYRTGDLGRWREDGNLEYLGRIDDQVKIRGYRIELGEIEQAISSHKASGQAVVIARAINNTTDKELIAYTTGEATAEELKTYLKERLPSYMVPNYYVKLESIPLTSNGKVDRKALPDPEGTGLKQGEYIAPVTETEKRLVKIWSEVLRAKEEEIGLESDFFALGGDSIKAIQIVARLRNAGYELKISDVMGSSRLQEMALKLKPLTRKIDQGPEEGEVLLSPIQRAFLANAFAKGTEDEKQLFHQSFMLCFSGGLKKEETRVIIEKLIAHHDVLRMRYEESGQGDWQQYNGGLQGDYYLLEEASLPSLIKDRSQKEVFFEEQGNKLKQRIGFREGPLLGVGLYHDTEANESHLLLSIHHMVIDLVSWRILFEDIDTLLNQYRKGKKLILPEKTDSYRYWMERSKEYAQGHLLERQRQYWEQQQIAKTDRIPVQAPKGSNTFKQSRRVGFELSKEETALVQQGMHARNKVETNAILLAALSRALKSTFCVEQVRVLLEGHGREEYLEKTDISRTVGWFTSMYPFVLDGKQESVESVLLLQDALGQVPDKGVGYGLLRYLSKEPLPAMEDAQVTFNYLGDFTREEQATTSIATTNTFSYSEYGHGLDVHLNLTRESELEVSGQSENGCLQMSIQYSAARMDADQMQKLSEQYKAQLINLSEELVQYDKALQLPGSFTYKGLTLEQIAALEKEYGGIEDVYRLSPMQQGLYYHALSEPDSHAYFEQFGYGLKGALDITKLEQAYRTLIARHGVLRTVFRNDLAEEPLQVVLKEGIIDFRYEDIRDKDYSQQEQYIKQLREADKDESFDLTAGPLVRLIIVQQSENRFYQIWSNHHLNLDGWSTNAVLYEFDVLYRSLISNQSTTLPNLEPYSRYIAWLDGIDHQKSKTYWNEYLSDYDSKAVLPFDKEDMTQHTGYIPKDYEFWLSEELSNNLNAIAQKEKTTLNTIVQSAWGVLLSRYNNTQDVVFGSVVSGRPSELKGIQEMIGVFINTVPQRIRYTDQMTFSELLQSTQQSFIAGEQHHHLNLAEIQQESELGNNLIGHLVVFENYPISGSSDATNKEEPTSQKGAVSIEGDTVEWFEQMNYDFSLMAAPEESLFFRMKYNGLKYSEGFIKRLEGQWKQLLREIAKSTQTSIAAYDILTQEEKTYLLETLNDTKSDYPKDKTIVDLFEEQVKLNPENIAVKFKDTVITYRELNEKSNQLAHYLIKNYNIQLDELVGIELERSEWMVIGILAIIKSGGAYVPIDPEYPEQRKAFIKEDANLKVIITEQELEKFKQANNTKEYPSTNPIIKLSPNNLMYVIYTSGSTGNPKGCTLEHGGLVNRLTTIWDTLGFGNDERILQSTTFTFDVSLSELIMPLLKGVCTILTDKNTLLHPKELVALINKEKITSIHAVPGLLEILIDDNFYIKGNFKELRRAVSAGEPLSESLLQDWCHKTNVSLFNYYGPTETSIYVLGYQTDISDKSVHLGKSLPNTETYLLDSTHRLVPYGSIGEICIGGVGLARGYLNRLDLTKEKFITNPYNPTQRLYRTGDLGRWREDGNLEYLGRIDDQVKIRGYRIELGEIEQAISSHKSSGQVVVIARAINNTSDKELIAYTTGEASAEELKAYLKERLPSYMVPNYYVRLESIPLTSNGKVDRKALPDPEGTGLQQGAYVAPRTEIEKQLVKIWSTVLGVEERTLGISADFFDLGGHSLKAVKLMSILNKSFNLKSDIRFVFDNLCIEEMAQVIQTLTKQNNSFKNTMRL
jgi:amino acid adenylation domain-containing protein/non-ribosomal peptide synthase protein (TIGR01720 family)